MVLSYIASRVLMILDNVVQTKQRAVYRWMLEPADRDAVLANVAIKNGSKGYHVIV